MVQYQSDYLPISFPVLNSLFRGYLFHLKRIKGLLTFSPFSPFSHCSEVWFGECLNGRSDFHRHSITGVPFYLVPFTFLSICSSNATSLTHPTIVHSAHYYHPHHHPFNCFSSSSSTAFRHSHLINELDRRSPRKALWRWQKHQTEAAFCSSQAKLAKQHTGKAASQMEYIEPGGGGTDRCALATQTRASPVGRWSPQQAPGSTIPLQYSTSLINTKGFSQAFFETSRTARVPRGANPHQKRAH